MFHQKGTSLLLDLWKTREFEVFIWLYGCDKSQKEVIYQENKLNYRGKSWRFHFSLIDTIWAIQEDSSDNVFVDIFDS